MACSNNFKQIGLGIHNYNSAYRQIPMGSGGTGFGTSDRSGNSYRLSGLTALLPFVEQVELWNEISNPYPQSAPMFPAMGPVPWISGAEYPAFATRIETFECPSTQETDDASTNYAFCYGDTIQYSGMNLNDIAAAEGIDASQMVKDAPDYIQVQGIQSQVARGMFMSNRALKFRDILDGLSNTIAMAEVGHGYEGRANTTVAQNLSVTNFTMSNIRNAVLDPTRPAYLANSIQTWPESRGSRWADGRIRISGFTTVGPPNFPSATPQGSEFGGVYSAGSAHQGGCHVLMGDGAVKFITDSIEAGDQSSIGVTTPDVGGDAPGSASPFGLWGALGTRANKEKLGM